MYLIHWPIALVPSEHPIQPELENGKPKLEHVDIIDTWKELEKLVENGLTRRIGVSNFSIEILERMQFSPEVKIQPYVNQVEFNLYNQQHALIDYLSTRNIRLTAYSLFGKMKNGPFGVKLIEDPVLIEIGKEIGKKPSQIALKFLIQFSPIVSVIPKSVSPERMKDNFDLNFELSNEHIKRLKARNRAHRCNDPYDFYFVDALSLGH